jgi:Asp-tRNA(Asn)/Glu-tRNA(Gln) amidotransferase A subunit family amidase
VGFQVIAAHGRDGELLRIAEWVARAAKARLRPAAVH